MRPEIPDSERLAVRSRTYDGTTRAITQELFRNGPNALAYEIAMCMRMGEQTKAFGFDYSDIPQPTTVFVAQMDVITPPSLGRHIQSTIRGSKLVEVPKASHTMFI